MLSFTTAISKVKMFVFCILLQEASFRKVVQATAVRDRQHGPVVELNRIQVRLIIHNKFGIQKYFYLWKFV